MGPEIRSGEISGAEAKRKVRDPKSPKPPSQVQRLKMKLEAKTLECETELAANEALRRELREAKAQVSEYPHEREAVKNWPDNDDLETRAVTPAPGDVGQAQQSTVGEPARKGSGVVRSALPSTWSHRARSTC